MGIIEQTIQEGTLGRRLRVARGEYNFAVDGGAIGTIPLMGATLIPSGATIIGGWIEVQTTLTSGGAATIAVQVEGAGDIVPATAVASWTAGRKKIVPAMDTSAALAAATDVRTTAARDISAVIAAATLTAGKFSAVLLYLEPLA